MPLCLLFVCILTTPAGRSARGKPIKRGTSAPISSYNCLGVSWHKPVECAMGDVCIYGLTTPMNHTHTFHPLTASPIR
ncbi:hypothetical protein F5883DRAFT_535430 [Diaporthe sp. PMI_573]|nr:hypothetical protein F5883DRAFT_535430 [Diaporthaceae sp. PMI_573]